MQQFGITGDDFVAGAGIAFLKKAPYEGDLIVADFEKDIVYRLSPEQFCSEAKRDNCGQPLEFLNNGISEPVGLAVNSIGEIFVSTFEFRQNRGQVLRFSTDGKFVESVATASGGISGIAFDHDDNLWYATTRAVFKLTPLGTKVLVASVPEFGLGIAICEK